MHINATDFQLLPILLRRVPDAEIHKQNLSYRPNYYPAGRTHSLSPLLVGGFDGICAGECDSTGTTGKSVLARYGFNCRSGGGISSGTANACLRGATSVCLGGGDSLPLTIDQIGISGYPRFF